MSDLIEMLQAASRDDRLADGMLYRKAADEIERLRRVEEQYYKLKLAAHQLIAIREAGEWSDQVAVRAGVKLLESALDNG